MTDLPPKEDLATLTGPTTLVIKRWLPARPERVWAYLTDSELRRKWLASGDMAPATGSPFTLTWRNDELSPGVPAPEGHEGGNTMESEILAWDEPRRLEFKWGDGTVTFELEPNGEKTLLTLTHTGITSRSGKVGISAGWHAHLDLLRANTAGQPHAPFWARYGALQDMYEGRVPE